jgi:hypothetical protein
VYAAAAALAVLSFRRSRPVFFFIAFFFAAMAPTANLLFPIGTIMAERVLYLPSVAFAGCLAWAGWKAYRQLRPRLPALRIAAPVALAALCLAFCGRTFARNFDWLDEHSLWSSAARACPDSYRPHEHLAKSLASPPRKAFEAAGREAERAVAILQPLPDEQRVAVAYSTAGYCYRVTGESLGPGGGAVWYRKALDVLLAGKVADEAWDREFARQNSLVGNTVGPVHFLALYLELGRTYRDLGQYQNALDALAADRGAIRKRRSSRRFRKPIGPWETLRRPLLPCWKGSPWASPSRCRWRPKWSICTARPRPRAVHWRARGNRPRSISIVPWCATNFV